MVGEVSNFILATTLLNQGPAAFGAIVDDQPELLEQNDELIGLQVTFRSLEVHLSSDDLNTTDEGYSTAGHHGLQNTIGRLLSYQPARGRHREAKTVARLLLRLSSERFAELAAQSRAIGLSLFAPDQTMARARAALGAAPAASSATDDLADDPLVGDRALLEMVVIERLAFLIRNPSFDQSESPRALSRLIRKASSGNRKAEALVEGFVNPGSKDDPMGSFHRIFQQAHVEAMQKVVNELPEDKRRENRFWFCLENLRTLRPNLFTDSDK